MTLDGTPGTLAAVAAAWREDAGGADAHPVVVVEGLDGSGKSTVCEALVTAQNGTFYKGMSEEFRDFRDFVDTEADRFSRFLYYVSAAFFTSARIRDSRATSTVVCHRFFSSYLAIYSLNTGTDLESLWNAFEPFMKLLVKPDLTILLGADHRELSRRLTTRGGELKPTDLRVVASEEYTRQFATRLSIITRWYGEVVEIDTLRKPPEQVIGEVNTACLRQIPRWKAVPK